MAAILLALCAGASSGGSCFLSGSQTRRTSLWTVLVFPVFVIALAYVLLHERPSRTQQLGIATALTGVALIAAG